LVVVENNRTVNNLFQHRVKLSSRSSLIPEILPSLKLPLKSKGILQKKKEYLHIEGIVA